MSAVRGQFIGLTSFDLIDYQSTFIALLGAHLNVAVVLDGAAGGTQKINSMVDKGIINSKMVISLASLTGAKEADIEDMFEESWYLALATTIFSRGSGCEARVSAASRGQDFPVAGN